MQETTDSHTDNQADKARQLVRAALHHVPFDGWSDASLNAAAEECGITTAQLAEILPGGPAAAVTVWLEMADQEMCEGFARLDPAPARIPEKIRALILLRLEQTAPHKMAVRRTLSFLARPDQAKRASQTLYRTVDAMWRAAGDRATDFSFYSKRATLSAVYSATLLAWLADDSPDMDETKAFLDRRLADVANIPKLVKPFSALRARFQAGGPGFRRRKRRS